jgi:hypothetical protein
MVLSNAVIEHVGDIADQRRFVAEHRRVARAGVMTTPNRWFPVESHTGSVLLHWFGRWRRGPGRPFTRLLSLRELRALVPGDAHVEGTWLSPTFLASWPAGDPRRRSRR